MITSRDGATINYEVEGRGRHVTLVHGVGSHLQAWDGVVAALRDEFTLLRYDLRGHAKSGKPPGPYALDDYVADLAALLDAQSVDRTTLVGFSFGGTIAPAFTVRYPNRVQALAIVSAVAGRTAEQRSSDGSHRSSEHGTPKSSSARSSGCSAMTPRATPRHIAYLPSPTSSTSSIRSPVRRW